MAKKPEATEAKKPVEAKKPAAAVEAKKAPAPKAHTAKPGTNPFVQQHPGKPGRSAAGADFNSRRNTSR